MQSKIYFSDNNNGTTKITILEPRVRQELVDTLGRGEIIVPSHIAALWADFSYLSLFNLYLIARHDDRLDKDVARDYAQKHANYDYAVSFTKLPKVLAVFAKKHKLPIYEDGGEITIGKLSYDVYRYLKDKQALGLYSLPL